MQQYTNQTGLSLFAQVFLATDHYDFSEAGISATTLLKPLKQVILGNQVPVELRTIDVIDKVSNRNGAAIHDGFERAWTGPTLPAVLESLGLPPAVIAKVRVNPTDAEVEAGGIIPVYMEQRLSKMVNGVKVTGKFDAVVDGVVEDLKNTKVWKFIANKDEDYIMQGSIYRWLDPKKITKDWMNLTFNFTDWKQSELKYIPGYPAVPMITKRLQLKSLAETEAYVTKRVSDLLRLKNAPEESLPPCSDADLWRKPNQWRFYSDSNKAYTPGAKSTKNFDDHASAMLHQKQQGKGVIIEKKGEVLACKYCPAFAICKQKDLLIASGDLVL